MVTAERSQEIEKILFEKIGDHRQKKKVTWVWRECKPFIGILLISMDGSRSECLNSILVIDSTDRSFPART